MTAKTNFAVLTPEQTTVFSRTVFEVPAGVVLGGPLAAAAPRRSIPDKVRDMLVTYERLTGTKPALLRMVEVNARLLWDDIKPGEPYPDPGDTFLFEGVVIEVCTGIE